PERDGDEPTQLGFGLVEPGFHLQPSEHRRGSGEVYAGGMFLSRPAVERSEPAMTASDEGAHAEPGRHEDRLAVPTFDRLDVRRVALRADFGEEVDGIGPMPALAVGARVRERALPAGARLVEW